MSKNFCLSEGSLLGEIVKKIKLCVKDKSITTSKLADKAVTNSKLADGAVTSAKLGNGSVTSDKIADSSINSSKIAAGAISADKIATDALNNKVDTSILFSNEKSNDAMIDGQDCNRIIYQDSRIGYVHNFNKGITIFIGKSAQISNPVYSINGTEKILRGKETIELTQDSEIILWYPNDNIPIKRYTLYIIVNYYKSKLFTYKGHLHAFYEIYERPTTLDGYGITDAVKQVSGKVLSTNDYTDNDKNAVSETSTKVNNLSANVSMSLGKFIRYASVSSIHENKLPVVVNGNLTWKDSAYYTCAVYEHSTDYNSVVNTNTSFGGGDAITGEYTVYDLVVSYFSGFFDDENDGFSFVYSLYPLSKSRKVLVEPEAVSKTSTRCIIVVFSNTITTDGINHAVMLVDKEYDNVSAKIADLEGKVNRILENLNLE